jgi:hypothetical protein
VVTASAGQTAGVDESQAAADPCGLVTLEDVQAVLAGAPAGEATMASPTAGLCVYAIDVDQKVTISIATGPADTMQATKDAVAKLSGQTVVDGLGDVGYTSTTGTRLDAHFFTGNAEVLVSAFGQPGGVDPLVALAKKVDAAM